MELDDYELVEVLQPQDENFDLNVRPGEVGKLQTNKSEEQDENLMDIAENIKDPVHGAKLLGCRLELKWSSGKWYRGTICEYNLNKRKHKVMYDDGDLRWYYLPEMIFRFVKEEEEWVKC